MVLCGVHNLTIFFIVVIRKTFTITRKFLLCMSGLLQINDDFMNILSAEMYYRVIEMKFLSMPSQLP
jgi:hypothetical protein